jgi:hypothetical protein
MSNAGPLTLRGVLGLSALVEFVTGTALLIVPAFILPLLVGASAGLGEFAPTLGRCFGIALMALGTACWPGQKEADRRSPAFRGLLVYNVLIALFLVYLGTAGHLAGRLLWPAVGVHAAIILLMLWV